MTETIVSDPSTPLADRPLEQLEHDIWQGAANLTAAEHAWLLLVAEFDRREAYGQWECASTAAWLSWQVGLDMRAAREKVRVARAFEEFPLISAAMASGELSYSKVRAITRIATPEIEETLVIWAKAGTSNQIERIVSGFRRVERRDASAEEQQHEELALRYEVNDNGSLSLRIDLPSDAGVAALAAIEQFLAAPDAASRKGFLQDTLATRRAEAFMALIEAASAIPEDQPIHDRYLVSVHVGAELLAGGDGRCDISTGSESIDPIGVTAETARRLACDATVQVVTEDDDGKPKKLSRRQRVARGRLRRKIRLRDGGCRFPGCSQHGRIAIHHIVHYTNDGPTEPSNLVCLCRKHHRAVHEGGWSIVDVNGELHFRNPNGDDIAAAPPKLLGDAAEVTAHGRSAAIGRCQWLGDGLDLGLAVSNLCETIERALPRESDDG